MADTAVLVMAYGTPAGPAEIEPYYTHIRRGRPPSPEALAELTARYEAIGGVSPLREITERQAAGIEAALGERAAGRYRTFLGMKHAPPFIEDAIADIVAAGITEVIGLVLAPHHSRMSVGQYHARAEAAADGRVDYRGVGSWHDHPAYVRLLAARVAGAVDRVPADRRDDTHVLFTAHSLPSRIVADGDTYPIQLRETAEAVSGTLGLQRSSIAWQSAGRTADEWLGPDILDVLGVLADAHDVRGVVVCPCGFVSDHLEVLYDVDIEARDAARTHGLHLERTAMPNDDPAFCALLADVVTGHAR